MRSIESETIVAAMKSAADLAPTGMSARYTYTRSGGVRRHLLYGYTDDGEQVSLAVLLIADRRFWVRPVIGTSQADVLAMNTNADLLRLRGHYPLIPTEGVSEDAWPVQLPPLGRPMPLTDLGAELAALPSAPPVLTGEQRVRIGTNPDGSTRYGWADAAGNILRAEA